MKFSLNNFRGEETIFVSCAVQYDGLSILETGRRYISLYEKIIL